MALATRQRIQRLLACRLQRHQRQRPTKHSARINIVLIIVVITRLKRRMAKPEMVRAGNSAMAPRRCSLRRWRLHSTRWGSTGCCQR